MLQYKLISLLGVLRLLWILIVTLSHWRDPCVCVPVRVCVLFLFPASSLLALPSCCLFVDFLSNSSFLPPFCCRLPTSLLPPRPLIPPSPVRMSSALLCKRHGRGVDAFPAAVVVLSLLCCAGSEVFLRLAGWSETEIRDWGTNGCSWGLQCPFAQVSWAEETVWAILRSFVKSHDCSFCTGGKPCELWQLFERSLLPWVMERAELPTDGDGLIFFLAAYGDAQMLLGRSRQCVWSELNEDDCHVWSRLCRDWQLYQGVVCVVFIVLA